MSYQVLARKYRPRNFTGVAGQEHVLKALVNALNNDRLHHAYLFTGTRGVGKTSIARILARCLNCEKGITADPCGECSSCLEIAEGRSVDLIEVDAASRTKVEDTRELLDNVQYLPTHSRFKIYLIDEVHMLSTSSFNALLKTLEEPPDHVKFLLATTDPKKLPVTVLSRCLQFNLKNLTPERIVECLKEVLTAESINYDEAALWHLGRAADGSMRDALSLTDQAISFCGDRLDEESVKTMLGSMDQNEVLGLLNALAARDGGAMMEKIAELSVFAPDYGALLSTLLSALHRIAVAQLVPEALDNSHGDQGAILNLAREISKEDVQLYYQIGQLGQRDLNWAPDPRTGFEMTLLRMLAFEPLLPPGGQQKGSGEGIADAMAVSGGSGSGVKGSGATARQNPGASSGNGQLAAGQARSGQSTAGQSNKSQPSEPQRESSPVTTGKVASSGIRAAMAALKAVPESTQASSIAHEALGESESKQSSPVLPEKQSKAVHPAAADQEKRPNREGLSLVPKPANRQQTAATSESKSGSNPEPHTRESSEQTGDWKALLERLPLEGITQTLAMNCTLHQTSDSHWVLTLNREHESLWNSQHDARIGSAVSRHLGREVKVSIEVGDTTEETPAEILARQKAERQAAAEQAIEKDKQVQHLIQAFGGRLNPGSIRPLETNNTGEKDGH